MAFFFSEFGVHETGSTQLQVSSPIVEFYLLRQILFYMKLIYAFDNGDKSSLYVIWEDIKLYRVYQKFGQG